MFTNALLFSMKKFVTQNINFLLITITILVNCRPRATYAMQNGLSYSEPYSSAWNAVCFNKRKAKTWLNLESIFKCYISKFKQIRLI